MHRRIVFKSEHSPLFIKSASQYELMLSRDLGMLKTECPKCKHHTFFYGVTGIVDSEIPENAVEIMYVAAL